MCRRPALPAACAALVLVIAQLLALAHQAETRHVTCAEHGEELEAAALAESLHACGDDHLVGIEGDARREHADCAIARALHQSSAAPTAWLPPAIVVAALPITAPRTLDQRAHISALYRLAPKTSPPA